MRPEPTGKPFPMPKRKPAGRRSFPGRLTLEQWLELPYVARFRLFRRAQNDLLGSFRFCNNKKCRRARACCGEDVQACLDRLRRRRRQLGRWQEPKRLMQEWARLHDLSELRGAVTPRAVRASR